MTDRERMYSAIIHALVLHKDDWCHKLLFHHKGEYTKGNILVAITTISPNDWSVAYYDHYDKEKGCVVVKDMITGKLCNYYNETFFEMPSEWIGKYTLLTDKKYKIYKKCNEFLKESYYRFHSLDFDDKNKTFTFRLRKPFTDVAVEQITISTELSLKEIKEKLFYGEFEEIEVKENE